MSKKPKISLTKQGLRHSSFFPDVPEDGDEDSSRSSEGNCRDVIMWVSSSLESIVNVRITSTWSKYNTTRIDKSILVEHFAYIRLDDIAYIHGLNQYEICI